MSRLTASILLEDLKAIFKYGLHDITLDEHWTYFLRRHSVQGKNYVNINNYFTEMTYKPCPGLQPAFSLKILKLCLNMDYMSLHLMNTEPKFLVGILFEWKITMRLTFTQNK